MVVMPISVASTVFGAANNVSFSGYNRRKNNGDTEGSPVEYNRSSNNLAKVPVIVLMAMSPAMMNAKTPVNNLSEMEGEKAEIITPIPIASEELDEMSTISPEFNVPPTNQINPPFGVAALNGHRIYHTDTFMKDGKKHYIVYSGLKSSDNVSKVSVFPEGFRNENGKQLPFVQELIYHDLGKEKEYCGVIVRSIQKLPNGKFKSTKEEVRLPDKCAQTLIDLLANYSSMKNFTSIKYSETKSAQLRPTVTTSY